MEHEMALLTLSTIQKMNTMWMAADNPYNKYNRYNCVCDFCHQKKWSTDCRIYHTANLECKGLATIIDGISVIKDHIIICFPCRFRLNDDWISCRCKRKDTHA